MKRQLSNTIYGLEFAMEKNDFERLKSSSGKKRNDFVANPIDIIDVSINIRSFNCTKIGSSQIYLNFMLSIFVTDFVLSDKNSYRVFMKESPI